jgi:endonuclease/exonuclease/phosphatase family metal-dependent hydrolase
VSTHLSFVPGWNTTQLRRLRRDLTPLTDPVVLMGDLNLTGDRPATVTGYQSLARALTFPAHMPTRQLDHILLRGVLAPVRATAAVALAISDHQALVVDL